MLTDDNCAKSQGVFVSRPLRIRKCLNCNLVTGKIENTCGMYIPVGGSRYHHSTVQSLLWDWCTLVRRNHTEGNCVCDQNNYNFVHRSFLLSAPALLTMVLHPTVFNRTNSAGLIDKIRVKISSATQSEKCLDRLNCKPE